MTRAVGDAVTMPVVYYNLTTRCMELARDGQRWDGRIIAVEADGRYRVASPGNGVFLLSSLDLEPPAAPPPAVIGRGRATVRIDEFERLRRAADPDDWQAAYYDGRADYGVEQL